MRATVVTYLLVLVLVVTGSVYGQQGEWNELEGAPLVGRYNDASFVSEKVGWIVNGEGEVYRTTNWGSSWRLMLSNSASHFRSVGFVDERTGWLGNVGLGEFGTTDPVVLRRTDDGGSTWSEVTGFDGPEPVGLCGMQVLNDSTVAAVGRVRGPAVFVKTTDRGDTWSSVALDSLAAGLIDVHFFTPDSGLAVGLSDADHSRSSGVILSTTDGGQTWTRRFTTSRTGEWFWKMSFPSRSTGYVSLQRNSQTPIYFVKTTDGGLTWEEKLFSTDYYFVQGLGFINEDVGWIGGNSSRPTFETRDGGETWSSAGFGSRVNRFRFLGDSVAYAVGRRVYKYETQSSVFAELDEIPADFEFYSSHPNPFSDAVAIEFALARGTGVYLDVIDVTGRRVRSLLAGEQLPAGRHSISWDATDRHGRSVSSGFYIYRLNTNRNEESGMMLLVK